MLKQCIYCGKDYPETDFGVAVSLPEKIYRRRKCRYCYRKTKSQLIIKYRLWIEEYKKSKKCERCGENDYRVLDFHHKILDDKIFNVADFRHRVGFSKLKAEVEKCSLLCANCHRVEHYNEIKNI